MTATPETPIGSATGTHTSAEVELNLLRRLAQMAGLELDRARISTALAAGISDEPLERLSRAARDAGLHLHLCRMPLASALSLASGTQPLLIFNDKVGWIIVLGGGHFSVRVSSNPNFDETVVFTRRKLIHRLGVHTLEDEIEAAFVIPYRPAEGIRASVTDSVSKAHHGSPIWRLWGLLYPEAKDILSLIIFGLVISVLYLALPLAVNGLVSNLAFGSQSTPFQQTLLLIAAVLAGCLVLSAILRTLQYVVSESIQRRIFVRLAADMAWRLPRVKSEALDDVYAPEMVNRFLEVVTVQKSSSMLLLNGINIIIGGLIGLVVLGFYHPFLFVYMVVILTGLSLIVFVLGRGAVASSLAESRHKYDVVGWLEEVARYPRLFKGPSGFCTCDDQDG